MTTQNYRTVSILPVNTDQGAIVQMVTMLRAATYIPIPTRADNAKALVYRDDGYRPYDIMHWKPGMGIAIRLGQQLDGSWLILIDLDTHSSGQCAERALFTLRTLVGNAFAHCVLKRSTSGHGYHIIIRTPEPMPHNQRLYLDGAHVGEVHCQGGHCPLVGAFLQGDLTTLPLLGADAWADWHGALTIQCGTRSPITWTARWREMLYITRGAAAANTRRFRCSDGIPRAFQGTDRRHLIAQAVWRRLQRAQCGERSEAYANYIQSLALLATDAYGMTSDDKWRTIAAIAIQDCPKAGDHGYNVEKDTAAIISRIQHGDPRADGTGFFRIPFWAKPYTPPIRPRGRPHGRARLQLDALRGFFLRHAEGDRVEYLRMRTGPRPLTVAAIAHHLRISTRTVQRYLHQLRLQSEILCEIVVGRQGRLIVILLPRFAHVRPAETDGH
jgi:hypothetical protein